MERRKPRAVRRNQHATHIDAAKTQKPRSLPSAAFFNLILIQPIQRFT
jgi:hypothetical protein